MTNRQPPRFYGVRTYQDPIGRFTFRYPTGWYDYELEDNRQGIMYSPEATDPQTWFAVWSTELDEHAVAEDVDLLREGVDEGLAQLPESNVEQASEEVLGNLIKFERIYTFLEGDVRRKRKVFILYVQRWLLVFTWQGENEEEYDYWFPLGNYSFNTLNLAPELWFATDRDLVGLSRQP